MGKGVVFMLSYYEAIKDLPDNDRLSIYDAVMQYGFNGTEPQLSGIAKTVFTLIKPNVDSSLKKYRASVANGKRGGRPPIKKPSEYQTMNQKPNHDRDNEYDTDSEYDTDNECEKGIFAAPTLEAVKLYCFENGYSVDAERFFSYYAARNWMTGNVKMSDWKAAVTYWEKKDSTTRQRSWEAIAEEYEASSIIDV